MLDSMRMALEKPLLYKKSEGAFWNDAYISKQMLKAHLDPQFEGASRKRSIDYARESALQQELSITYLFQDYLQMNLEKDFDFGTMIYCDYGVLQHQTGAAVQLAKTPTYASCGVFVEITDRSSASCASESFPGHLAA